MTAQVFSRCCYHTRKGPEFQTKGLGDRQLIHHYICYFSSQCQFNYRPRVIGSVGVQSALQLYICTRIHACQWMHIVHNFLLSPFPPLTDGFNYYAECLKSVHRIINFFVLQTLQTQMMHNPLYHQTAQVNVPRLLRQQVYIINNGVFLD